MDSILYSKAGLQAVAAEIDRALSSAFDARKKITALDLDNTLWGGVIGENCVEGIELSDHKEGQRYYDFQRQLLEMKKRGLCLQSIAKIMRQMQRLPFGSIRPCFLGRTISSVGG